MKRAQKEEERCRRMEFKCRLYDIIKGLDRSLKSECGLSPAPPSQRGGDGLGNTYSSSSNQRKAKGSECCCPPGCCKESLEFRLPKLLPKEFPQGSPESAEGSQDPPPGSGSDYMWHNEDHSWGCRPVGEGGPGGRSGGSCCPGGKGSPGNNPNNGGGGPSNQGCGGGRPKCGEGSPDFGGGCCTYKPICNGSAAGPSPTEPFQFPQTPEEAIQRGCFVARSA